MPELPDLEVVRGFLAPRLHGTRIDAVVVRRPLLVRSLSGQDAHVFLLGQRFAEVCRRGKFLLFHLESGNHMVLNPMLAGRLRYGAPLGRDRVRDALILKLSNGQELRYHDAKDMGKIYLTQRVEAIPGFEELGPDALDPALTLDVFQARLRRHHGEIKGILTNQTFVAGIGNAYGDEVCWRAKLYPFRRRPNLTPTEVDRLYAAMGATLKQAIELLRDRVGCDIHIEIRDLLAIHGKKGEPCPRCGSAVSEVKRARRATHFCRTCQPGLMVDR